MDNLKKKGYYIFEKYINIKYKYTMLFWVIILSIFIYKFNEFNLVKHLKNYAKNNNCIKDTSNENNIEYCENTKCCKLKLNEITNFKWSKLYVFCNFNRYEKYNRRLFIDSVLGYHANIDFYVGYLFCYVLNNSVSFYEIDPREGNTEFGYIIINHNINLIENYNRYKGIDLLYYVFDTENAVFWYEEKQRFSRHRVDLDPIYENTLISDRINIEPISIKDKPITIGYKEAGVTKEKQIMPN